MLRLLFPGLVLSMSAAAQNPAATVTVDANANRHAIDPRVYGVAYGSTAQLSEGTVWQW